MIKKLYEYNIRRELAFLLESLAEKFSVQD